MGVNYVLPTSDDNYGPNFNNFNGTTLDSLQNPRDPFTVDSIAVNSTYNGPSEPDLVNSPFKTRGKIGFTGGFEVRYNHKRLAISAGLESDVLRYKAVYDHWQKRASNVLLGYLNLPVGIHYKLTEKIHLKVGGSVDYLAFAREKEKISNFQSGTINSTGTVSPYSNALLERTSFTEKDKFNPINLSLRGGLEYQIKKQYALFLNYRLKVSKVYNDEFDSWEKSIGSKTSNITIGILVN